MIGIAPFIQSTPTLMYLYRAGKYTGGYVQDPKKGIHCDHVIVLDFSSLYPTIMRANNLCTTTMLKSAEHAAECGLTPADYTVFQEKYYFVKEHVRKGLLPILLERLMHERQLVKQAIKEATDPAVQNMLKAKELAIKVAANAVYGNCGSKHNSEGCIAIADVVCGEGQDRIKNVAAYVVKKYPGLVLVYGDTDSVMFSAPPSVYGSDIFAFAKAMAKDVNTESGYVIGPMSIAVDKILCPMLLEGKKKYAGLKIQEDGKRKIISVGLENVRRDNPLFVSESLEQLLSTILFEYNTKPLAEMATTVIKMTRELMQDLLMNRLPLDKLVAASEIKKPFDQYVNPMIHTSAAKKQNALGRYAPLDVGDRVAYYHIVLPGYKVLKHETGITVAMYDPTKHALNFPIYVERLMKPFTRALQYILTPTQLSDLFNMACYSQLVPNSIHVSPLNRYFSGSNSVYREQGARKKIRFN
jgi:DNA polymerase delta subunit 1